MKYSQLLVRWLKDLGYTHCFFVAGGNIMHLLDGVREQMTCIPTVHEVTAGIAAEYFNAVEPEGRAFALVTAGPGMTNLVTALAGAHLESRELLVLAGQVKSSDLATGGIRQRGIQEVDGLGIAAPTCKTAARITAPIGRDAFSSLVLRGRTGRPGPVFVEVCLDASGSPVDPAQLDDGPGSGESVPADAPSLLGDLEGARRPVILLGGGVSQSAAAGALSGLERLGAPIMTTWNGADRIAADHPLYAGRPNTWGQRSSNVLLQQADVVLALGTRLGMQQTGFNWQRFAPLARVVQVDIDQAELAKGHPVIDRGVCADADAVLERLAAEAQPLGVDEWVAFCRRVRSELPAVEANETRDGYADPYAFVQWLSRRCADDDLVVPCSSGGAFTVAMQTWEQRAGQRVVTNKGLASMGYGLAGAIGAAAAFPGRRVIHMEGDGGFAQNLQEMATVAVNGLPVKTFLFANEGYASIRMTQRNYFGGAYLGCDTRSGLGFPDWEQLVGAYGVPFHAVDPVYGEDERLTELLAAPGPAVFVVPVDPEQTYNPKITSRVTESGSMESNPLHVMSPDLPDAVQDRVLPHLNSRSTA